MSAALRGPPTTAARNIPQDVALSLFIGAACPKLTSLRHLTNREAPSKGRLPSDAFGRGTNLRKLVRRIKIHPKLRARAERGSWLFGSFLSDDALTGDQFVHHSMGASDDLGKLSLGPAARFSSSRRNSPGARTSAGTRSHYLVRRPPCDLQNESPFLVDPDRSLV